nr:uncharacterized protein LOC105331900 isoform X2 [Crassostrea gigas]XP_034320387.1 uncharacterized protein LOC105331900 isoform X2 [Crassostrea gigas]
MSMMPIITKWKQVIVAFVIVSIIFGLHSSYWVQTDASIKRKTSFENTSCRLDPIVVRPESITLKMPPELEKVVPLWPNTRADRCIGNIKAKPMRKFSSNKYHSLYKCVERNILMRAMRDNSFKMLDRSINHAYFKDLKKKQGVTIIEIGGYLGVLLPKLVEATGTKQYVALEPVPSFYQQLSKKIEDLSLQSRVTTYNFGLAKSKKELHISIRKDATSLLKDDEREGVQTEAIKIYKVIDFFVQIGLGCNSLNLLTINCEGCEFDVIEILTSTSLIDNIDFIQFQPHLTVFDDDQKYICMYCRIRELLARTHEIAYDYPHVWETWKRKGIS